MVPEVVATYKPGVLLSSSQYKHIQLQCFQRRLFWRSMYSWNEEWKPKGKKHGSVNGPGQRFIGFRVLGFRTICN